MVVDDPCPTCLGLGIVEHWEPRRNSWLLVARQPWRDCPDCGGTGTVLPYDGEAIPPARALVRRPHARDW